MKAMRLAKHFDLARVEAAARGRGMGFFIRSSAVLLLALSLWHGAVKSGHFGPDHGTLMTMPGKLSGLIGLAADDIRITGLNHQSPETVLAALGIKPGSSLIGFDAGEARSLLENLDWVASAQVQRLFPNQLVIEVVERVPFAVWQKGGAYYVIDRSGAALSSLSPSNLPALPLVTGEGAEKEAEGLVNQLEATPDLLLKLYAAARVGKRRWNLYFDHGVSVLLPDRNVEQALAKLQDLETRERILSKGIRTVDLRFADRVIIGIADGAEGSETSSLGKAE